MSRLRNAGAFGSSFPLGVDPVPWAKAFVGNADALWPRSRLANFAIGGMIDTGGNIWEWDYHSSAEAKSGTRDVVIGVTRDANGNALGSCTVIMFDTALNLMVDKTTSDASGNYQLTTPIVGATNYVVAYKAGSPDVSGSTLNTLAGA